MSGRPVWCERCQYVDGVGLVPTREFDMDTNRTIQVEDAPPGRWVTAATVAGRATLFGFLIWLLAPPVSAENVIRAIAGTAPLMIIWWFFGGPGPRQRLLPAVAFGIANLSAAFLFARMLALSAS